MQTLIQNIDFTAANGSAWPTNQTTWTIDYVGATGSVDVQGNKGRMTSGTSGGFLDVARAVSKTWIAGPVEISGKFTLPNPYVAGYSHIGISNGAWSVGDTPDYAWILKLDQASATQIDTALAVVVAGTITDKITSFTHTAGATTNFKLRVAPGFGMQAKLWETADEPTGPWPYWFATTIGEFNGGYLHMRTTCGGGAGVASVIDWDDLKVVSLLPPTPVIRTYYRG